MEELPTLNSLFFVRALSVPADGLVAVVAEQLVIIARISLRTEPSVEFRTAPIKFFALFRSVTVYVVYRQKLWPVFTTAFALAAIRRQHLLA